MKSAITVISIALLVGATVGSLACAGAVDEDPVDDEFVGGDELSTDDIAGDVPRPMAPTSFPANRLLEDDQLLGGATIAIDDVQRFLELEGSFLATYSDPGSQQTAAAIIVERSRAYDINPLYMLARIQTESSLISSGSSANLDAATGCGCPDYLGCNPELGGFGNQIECASQKLRGYFDDLDAGRPTIAGWQLGEAHDSLDPCTIVPANKATAALYTYTPWTGAYADDCGRQDVGGSSLVALIYYRFAFAYDWPEF